MFTNNYWRYREFLEREGGIKPSGQGAEYKMDGVTVYRTVNTFTSQPELSSKKIVGKYRLYGATDSTSYLPRTIGFSKLFEESYGSRNTSYCNMFVFGKDNTPPSVDDDWVKDYIPVNIYQDYTKYSYSFGTDSEGGYHADIIVEVTPLETADMYEIGFVKYFSDAYSSTSDNCSGWALMFREVLDEPIHLEAGVKTVLNLKLKWQ